MVLLTMYSNQDEHTVPVDLQKIYIEVKVTPQPLNKGFIQRNSSAFIVKVLLNLYSQGCIRSASIIFKPINYFSNHVPWINCLQTTWTVGNKSFFSCSAQFYARESIIFLVTISSHILLYKHSIIISIIISLWGRELYIYIVHKM